MKIKIVRDTFNHNNTIGQLYIDGDFFGYTLEDTDRNLEDGGKKIKGQTAIPRGAYKVTISMSNRFKKRMPEIHNVPGFEGVRIHGGNTEANTEGCPLLGKKRTDISISDCAEINAELIRRIDSAISGGDVVVLTIE